MRTKFEKICSDFHTEAAINLIKSKTQTEISKLLCITQPAVSQYLNNMRGNGFVDEKYKRLIDELCNNIDNSFYVNLLKLCIQRYEEHY